MRVVPFFVLAVVLAGCQPQPQPEVKPQPVPKPEQAPAGQPSKGKAGNVVDVEIIGATHPKLIEACKTLNNPVNTIYVDTTSRQVFHCMSQGNLVPHADHGPGHVLSPADVPLSVGEAVRWFSTTHTFFVVSIVKGKEPPQSPSAPGSPFPLEAAMFRRTPTKETTSPPVPDLPGEVAQRYKVTFNLTGVGEVDPDVVCSM